MNKVPIHPYNISVSFVMNKSLWGLPLSHMNFWCSCASRLSVNFVLQKWSLSSAIILSVLCKETLRVLKRKMRSKIIGFQRCNPDARQAAFMITGN